MRTWPRTVLSLVAALALVAGLLGATQRSAGDLVVASFDALGNVVSTMDALAGVSANMSDADSRLTSAADQLSNVVGYTYDAAGRVTVETLQNGSTRTCLPTT